MADKNNIHAGHRARLRELCKTTNLDALPPHVVLELLLSFVIPHKDVNPLAHKLIDEFGSLHAVLEADTERLKKIDGIGEVSAMFLWVCSQIPLAYQKSKMESKHLLKTPNAVIDYLRQTIPIVGHEKFYLTYIDYKNELIKTEAFGTGDENHIKINLKELISKVLSHKVGGVIMCHTHPNGKADPSSEDVKFTRQVFVSLCSIGVPLLDHIVLSSKGSYSFMNNGHIEEFKLRFKDMIESSASLKNTIKFEKDEI